MCRWLAYVGSPIFLDAVLIDAEHSLIQQSLLAEQNYIYGEPLLDRFSGHAFPTNGDGFGIGWYGDREFPGLYRDCTPAWNDKNLRRVAGQLKSGHFLAHVRLGQDVQRSNNHPFVHGNWMFQHNGEINGWKSVRRELQIAVSDELYPFIEGTTDAETVFYLCLTEDLEHDPVGALRSVVAHLERVREKHGIEDPIRLTCCLSNGDTLYALRYSSDDNSKTLYHSTGTHCLREIDGGKATLPDDAILVVSEPLDSLSDHWLLVPERSVLVVRAGEVSTTAF